MHSKEEYEKALARIVNDDYYFENDPYGEDKASAFDKDVDMIEQLIEEHFKPKENTSEFKHFKIHSQLKNCIDELNGGVSAKYAGERLMDIMGLIKNNCGVD